MKLCPSCRQELPEISRYCSHCGQRLHAEPIELPPPPPRVEPPTGRLNVEVLYGMGAMLALAILFPPWETPPSKTPEFLGMHFILSPPTPDAVMSRLLLTIELVTIAIAGLYGAFLLRQKP